MNNFDLKKIAEKSNSWPFVEARNLRDRLVKFDKDNKLLGILTDGDIRRKLLKVQKPFSAFFVDDALEHAIRSPITILPDDSLIDAISIMDKKQVWDLPVVDKQNALVGLLHLHPAVEALLGVKS